MKLEKRIKQAQINAIIATILFGVELLVNFLSMFKETYLSLGPFLNSLFTVTLLIIALKKYETEPLKSAYLEKILASILIVETILSEIISYVIVGFIFKLEFITFNAVLADIVIGVIIPMFLLADGIQLPRIAEDEQGILKKYNKRILCIIGGSIAVLNIVMVIISVCNECKEQISNIESNNLDTMLEKIKMAQIEYNDIHENDVIALNEIICQIDNYVNAVKANNEISEVNKQLEKGDINGDGKLTMVDVSLLKSYIIQNKKLEGRQYDAADMNDDGEITMEDVSKLNQKLIETE